MVFFFSLGVMIWPGLGGNQNTKRSLRSQIHIGSYPHNERPFPVSILSKGWGLFFNNTIYKACLHFWHKKGTNNVLLLTRSFSDFTKSRTPRPDMYSRRKIPLKGIVWNYRNSNLSWLWLTRLHFSISTLPSAPSPLLKVSYYQRNND
jgi:hypothetical protein